MIAPRRFSVAILCYGNFPHYSLRAVRSVVEQVESPALRTYDIHVAANQCCQETLDNLRAMRDQGKIDTIVESRENLNKGPMKRLLFGVIETEYALWMDDDSFVEPGWVDAVREFIDQNYGFDVAGIVMEFRRYLRYREFLRQRPWFRGEEFFSEERREIARFAVGGCYLVRVPFAVAHNYPDKGMVKRFDDVLLGDLVAQQGGSLIDFSAQVRAHVRINEGERRGVGEDLSAFREVDPITGVAVTVTSEEVERRERHPLQDHDILVLNDQADRMMRVGAYDKAAELYRRALLFAEGNSDLHYNLGNALRLMGNLTGAETELRRAVELNERSPVALNNLGVLLGEQGRREEGRVLFERAIEADRDYAAGHYNLGNELRTEGDDEAALRSFRTAIALDPSISGAQFNIANILLRRGELHTAMLHARWALRGEGEAVRSRLQRGVLRLMMGDSVGGLRDLEVRRELPHYREFLRSGVEWQGESLAGKTVLVVLDGSLSEGLGHARCLSALIAEADRVVIECRSPEADLFRMVPGVEVVESSQGVPYDVWAPMLSLGLRFSGQGMSMTAGAPLMIDSCDTRLPATASALRVGLLWRHDGSPEFPRMALPLDMVLKSAEIPGVELFSLQAELRKDESTLLAEHRVREVGGLCESVQGLAKTLSALDLVISVDSMTAHLAAAIGTRTFVLVKENVAWQWGSRERGSPCHPQTQVFWLERAAGLTDLLAKVRSALRCEVGARFDIPLVSLDGELPAAHR